VRRNRRSVAETVITLLEATRAHVGFVLQRAGEQVLMEIAAVMLVHHTAIGQRCSHGRVPEPVVADPELLGRPVCVEAVARGPAGPAPAPRPAPPLGGGVGGGAGAPAPPRPRPHACVCSPGHRDEPIACALAGNGLHNRTVS
jgi:hypothetical protein